MSLVPCGFVWYFLIRMALLFALLLVLAAVSLSSVRRAMLVVVVTAPWMGIDFDLGLRFTAFRVAIVLFALSLFAHRRNLSMRAHLSRPSVSLFFFFGFACTWTLIQLISSSAAVGGGGLRSPIARPLGQIIMTGIMLAPVVLVPMAATRVTDVGDIAKAYIGSCVVLAVIGFVQVFWWFLFGEAILPVGYFSSLVTGGEVRSSGFMNLGGARVIRMCSFGGEPKGLGQSLVIALLLLQVAIPGQRRATNLKRLWVFLAMAVLLTWSSSGFFLWALGTAFLTLVGVADAQNKRRDRLRGAATVSMLLIGITAFSVLVARATEVEISEVADAFESRTFQRLEIEDFDEVVLAFLQNEPEYLLLGVGLGNVHLHAGNYLTRNVARYARGTPFVAKSGYLRILSELGFVGLILLLVYFWDTLRTAWLLARCEPMADAAIVTAAVAALGYLARTYVSPQCFVAIGTAWSYVYRQRLCLAISRSNAFREKRRGLRNSETRVPRTL